MSVLACILAGLAATCTYAAIAHVVAGLRQSFSAVHLVFALLSILVAAHSLAHIGVYAAPDVESYLAASRWSNLAGTIAMAVLPWFAYVYAAARNRWIPLALSSFYILVIIFYELTPVGSAMRAPPDLVKLILPWGEEATMHVLPRLPTALIIFWLVNFACFAYIYALCARQYQRGQRMHAIVFGLSVVMLPIALVGNMFILRGALDSLFLGEFGFVSLVLLMTLFLSSDENYRALVAQASDGIFLATPTGRYVDVNRAGMDMLGYSYNELRHLHILDVVQPTEHPRLADQAERLRAGESVRSEWQFRRKDGSSFVGEVSAQMLSDGRMLGVVRDITEHARLHDALRLLAQLGPAKHAIDFSNRCVGALTEAFGAANASIAICDRDSDSVHSLAAWSAGKPLPDFRCALSQAPASRLDGDRRSLFLRDPSQQYPQYAPFAGQPVHSHFAAGVFDTSDRLIGVVEVWGNAPLETGAESQRLLEVFANRIGAEFERLIAHGELQQLTATLEARVAARTAELAELNKQLEAFSYSVSHDLRAPVRAANAFADMLLAEHAHKLDGQAVHYLNRIRAAGVQMNSLIEGLLALAQASHQKLNRERVDLCELARQLAETLRESDPQRTVDFACCAQAPVSGDRRMLHIVLSNLIENAWKYSSKSPRACIEFGIRQETSETVYFVRDSGVGFDMRYTERLFEPFHRLHSAGEFSGCGIGLATVARILQRHGGRIWAESTPGEGATFFFTVPDGAADDSSVTMDTPILRIPRAG